MPDENGEYTQSDLVAIRKAIASGLLEVEFDGPDGERRVRYQSYDKMKKIERDIMVALGLCPRRARTTVVSTKGYN